jgi:hypothetical protein
MALALPHEHMISQHLGIWIFAVIDVTLMTTMDRSDGFDAILVR